MKKRQTEYTFEEARDAASARLTVIGDYCQNMGAYLKNDALLAWARVFRIMQTKVSTSSRPVLAEKEVKEVWNFAQTLITANSAAQPKLRAFWECFDEITKTAGNPGKPPEYELRKMVTELSSRIDHADEYAASVVHAMKQPASQLLAASSLLLAFLIRVETATYALRKQTKEAIAAFGLTGIDDVEMFSVRALVPCGTENRPDVIALRDAIAHGHFTIKASEKDWSVQFHNDTKGYHYHEAFTHKDLGRLFDEHTFILKAQLVLLLILELLPLLADHHYVSQNAAG